MTDEPREEIQPEGEDVEAPAPPIGQPPIGEPGIGRSDDDDDVEAHSPPIGQPPIGQPPIGSGSKSSASGPGISRPDVFPGRFSRRPPSCHRKQSFRKEEQWKSIATRTAPSVRTRSPRSRRTL